jgi:hypothetical protein
MPEIEIGSWRISNVWISRLDGYVAEPLAEAPGLFVPRHFEVQFKSKPARGASHEVELSFEYRDGRPVCWKIETVGYPEVPTRPLPVKTMIRQAIATVACRRHDIEPPFAVRPQSMAARRERYERLSRRPAGRPQGSGPRFGHNLEDVARVSREGGPHGTKAIMDAFEVPRSTALRLKRDARSAGLEVG